MPAGIAAEDYPEQRLARVRVQIDMLSDRLDAELERRDIDAQQVDRLASAVERLSDLERVLAGRPLPGSHRPSARTAKPIMPSYDSADGPVPLADLPENERPE